MEEQAIIQQVEGNVDGLVEAVVPELIDAANTFRNNPVLLVGIGLVGLSVGAVIGYQVAKKRLTTKYDQLMDQEIAEAREYFLVDKTGEFATPASAAEHFGIKNDAETEVEDKYGSGALLDPVIVVEEETVESRNIFVNGVALVEEEWDQEAEEADRSPERPYVITEDEYMENEPGHEQISVTYYEGDDVLADSSDDVINNTDTNVGDDNLLRFGHGSKDKHIVYIRNEKSGLDFEVAQSTGKYAVEVLALDESDISQTIPMRRRERGSEE